MDKSPIKELLFSIIRVAINGDYSEYPYRKDIAWEEVFSLAAKQGVLALAWDGLQRLVVDQKRDGKGVLELDRTLRLQWAFNVEQIEQRYERQRQVILRLARFYQEHEIRMMILKGYGLSCYYPQPNHRPCGDIDIWLYGDQKRADRLLHDLKGVKISEDEHHHTTFQIGGILVENHYDFLNIHAHRSNYEIEQILKEIVCQQEGDEIKIEEVTLISPPADFNALFLLRHAAAHFAAAEIGLRHVVDWALFVKHNHDRINWTQLLKIAHDQHMDSFLNCLNAISIDYLGLSATYLPPFQRNPSLERRVLSDILSPEFSKPMPSKLILRIGWKFHRWWANRWKHRMVYREGLLGTFFQQLYSHLLKPKSI